MTMTMRTPHLRPLDAAPSRGERRALERRADQVVRRTRGLMLPPDVVFRESVVLLGEGQLPQLVSRLAARHAIGMQLGHVLDDIERRTLPPGHLPAIVLIDGWAQALFLPVYAGSPGGDA